VPGWTFLGASYAASIVQGEYFGLGASSVNPPFATSGIAGPELANTNFTPITLSWTLGHGWFTALGVTFVAPIGSQWRSTATDLNLNPDFWTIAPGWAISYLDANWMLSANFRCDINTASRGVTMGAPFLPAGAANGFVSATNYSATSPPSTRSASGRSARWPISKRRPLRTSRAAASPAPRRSVAINRKSPSVVWSATTSAPWPFRCGSTIRSSVRTRFAGSTSGAA
jgi:hypothetical protein